MAARRPTAPGGENPGADVDRSARPRNAVKRTALVRSVPRALRRSARARAVTDGTSLRQVLVRALHEYAAGTWTPRPMDAMSESIAGAEAVSPSNDTEATGKFIQICASENDLFALDAEGNIYQNNFAAHSWEKLVASRSSQSPARADRPPRGGLHAAFP